eukprot:CAMPEP_0119151152 /NCGR_PEP_ID=MMETSP1310-20130426/45938_1 /TAXON_ID=464262 /ORGANISM="Genus nov. species nov., Strain RCC2339" /LENGTH=303 /DNA_ID=CAMNT_0007143403 /DNA_START=60 /DNA_END=968 /DNA_ORIENTATION=+
MVMLNIFEGGVMDEKTTTILRWFAILLVVIPGSAGEQWFTPPRGDDVTPCSLRCGFNITWDSPQFVCGSDRVTRPNSACLESFYSYTVCHHNVAGKIAPDAPWSVVGAGTCECPSDCTGRGTCNGGDGCVCGVGYTGVDCASIRCDPSACAGRGTCRNVYDVGDMCECDPGYAGSDCVASMGGIPATPILLPDSEYSSKDEYGDDHPVFNQSTIAVVHIHLAEEDLEYLLNPLNSDNDDYMPADMHFFNGNLERYLVKVGFRTKGHASRSYSKKSWKVNLKEFVDREDLAGIDHIAFKAAVQT